jgi:uncharacterized repeat protein (TIGR02543 family)
MKKQRLIFLVLPFLLAITASYSVTAGWQTVYSVDPLHNAGNDLLLVAISSPHSDTITVTFDPNGGNPPVPTSKEVTFGQPYGELATTDRTGYSFNGWFTTVSGDTLVISTTEVTTTTNHTLYAQWTADTITVTFNANGGSEPDPPSKEVTFGQPYGELATTDREGYSFDGWFTAVSGGTQVISATEVTTTTDHTLYAQWTADTYTVTFEANSGSEPDPPSKNVTFGQPYGELATTSRTGYSFNGWFTAVSGGTLVISTTEVTTTTDHTLHAQWTAATVTVTFNANGGSESDPPSKEVSFGQPYGELATTSRTGYSFDGWFTAVSGGTQVISTTEVTTTTDHTLYAQWTADTITVTFNPNGGSPPEPPSKEVTFGQPYGELATTSRTGYSFAGWFTAEIGGTQVTSTTEVTTTTDHTLYAQWTANTITVTFNANGGSPPDPPSEEVTFGQPYGELATTSRTGYNFAGWFTAEIGGTQVTSTTEVTTTTDHTLYAQWTADTITVTFNANGGSPSDPPSKNVTFGQPYDELATTSRTGYNFAGWFTAEIGGTQVTSTTEVTTTTDHTLYAQWTANTITVTFNANGGSPPDPPSEEVTFGQPYGELATTSRTGYNFAGWFTAEIGGTQVTSTTEVTTTTDHTLYAQWTADTITVTFNANGGSPSDPPSKNVTFGQPYDELATTSRTGYSFDGWFTAASGGTQVTADTVVTTATDHTLYAQWTAATVTVTFNANGGSPSDPPSKDVTFGQPYGPLATTSPHGLQL